MSVFFLSFFDVSAVIRATTPMINTTNESANKRLRLSPGSSTALRFAIVTILATSPNTVIIALTITDIFLSFSIISSSQIVLENFFNEFLFIYKNVYNFCRKFYH